MDIHSNARTCPRSREAVVERSYGESVATAARDFAISVRTTFKWRKRAREGGANWMLDRSSRPRRSPRSTEPARVELIELLRRCRLTGPAIAHALGMPSSTVAAVLKRLGLSRLQSLEPPRPANRYEYPKGGDLIHVDTKKLGRIVRPGHRISGNRRDTVRGAGWEYAHVAIDDASRLAYVEVLDSETARDAVGFLERASAYYARHGITIRRLMSDNGSAYVSRLFAQACAKLGIRHLRTRPYTPRTNGKAERFIQTLLREWAYVICYRDSRRRRQALPRWLRYYNHQRPHAGIHRQTPYARLLALGE
jgi:transposase InsO family protein